MPNSAHAMIKSNVSAGAGLIKGGLTIRGNKNVVKFSFAGRGKINKQNLVVKRHPRGGPRGAPAYDSDIMERTNVASGRVTITEGVRIVGNGNIVNMHSDFHGRVEMSPEHTGGDVLGAHGHGGHGNGSQGGRDWHGDGPGRGPGRGPGGKGPDGLMLPISDPPDDPDEGKPSEDDHSRSGVSLSCPGHVAPDGSVSEYEPSEPEGV